MSSVGQLPQLPSTGSSSGLATVLQAVGNSGQATAQGQAGAASAVVDATMSYIATPIVKYFVGGIGAALILIGIIGLTQLHKNPTFVGIVKKGVEAGAVAA